MIERGKRAADILDTGQAHGNVLDFLAPVADFARIQFVALIHRKYREILDLEGMKPAAENIAERGKRVIPILLKDLGVPWKSKLSKLALERLLPECSLGERSRVMSRVAEVLSHANPTVVMNCLDLLKDYPELAVEHLAEIEAAADTDYDWVRVAAMELRFSLQ